MVEKRPKFTGPLVNSWPARLLTLEIARFSLICWDPKQCRNHYFCSINRLRTLDLWNWTPKKEGPKTSASTEQYQKTPPPPLAAYWLFLLEASKNLGKNSVFRFSRSRFLAHFFFFFWVLFAAENLSSKFVPLFRGGQKQGKKQGFFACLVADFVGGGVFLCGVLMLVFLFMCLLHCKCVIRPCYLTCSFCFPLCFFFGGGWLFIFLH